MSFIGPRPELLKYVNQYQGDERLILEVRPGITDFSSVVTCLSFTSVSCRYFTT